MWDVGCEMWDHLQYLMATEFPGNSVRSCPTSHISHLTSTGQGVVTLGHTPIVQLRARVASPCCTPTGRPHANHPSCVSSLTRRRRTRGSPGQAYCTAMPSASSSLHRGAVP